MAFLGVVGVWLNAFGNAVFFSLTDLVFEAGDLLGALYINGDDIWPIGVVLE
jgi:hypothetical protein